MKEIFLQIAEYIEALEKRLAAVEVRLAAAESKLAITQTKLADTQAKFAEMGQHVAELEARPVIEDSEIEMDWIEDEPEVPTEPEVSLEPEVPAETEQPVEPKVEAKPVQEAPTLFATPKEEPARPEPIKPQLPNKPVADLKHAISLGDRFLFQRELFAQNGELMQKTLEALNGMPNLDGALAYLDKHFDWDKESSTYTLFLNALHRRFG